MWRQVWVDRRPPEVVAGSWRCASATARVLEQFQSFIVCWYLANDGSQHARTFAPCRAAGWAHPTDPGAIDQPLVLGSDLNPGPRGELMARSYSPGSRSAPALADADLDPGLYDLAIGDPGTWKQVRAEHERLVDDTGAFGVPSLRLDAGEGPCMFGPVISEVPADDEALELFEHALWLMRNANFHELKGGRTVYPDLPHIKKALADRAAAAASPTAP